MVQVLAPFAERQIVYQPEFEIVGDVVEADRFFQTAIILVRRARIIGDPIRVGIGKQLRETYEVWNVRPELYRFSIFTIPA